MSRSPKHSRAAGSQKLPRFKAAAAKLGFDYGPNWSLASDAAVRRARIELQRERSIAASRDLEQFAKQLRASALAGDLPSPEVATLMRQATAARRLARKFSKCTSALVTNFDPEASELTIAHRHACKHRLCPNCAPSRARKQLVELFTAVQLLREVEPDTTFILLTLTKPLSSLGTLRDSLRTLGKNVRKLLKQTRIKVIVTGYVAVFEVTLRDGEKFHDHAHVLLCVDRTYRPQSALWVPQSEWVRLWAATYRTSQPLVVDVRFLKGQEPGAAPEELRKSLAELTTYLCAPLSLMTRDASDAGWHCNAPALLALAVATHRMRMIANGGTIKHARRIARQRREAQRRAERKAILTGAP
jgi:hypothetical protein